MLREKLSRLLVVVSVALVSWAVLAPTTIAADDPKTPAKSAETKSSDTKSTDAKASPAATKSEPAKATEAKSSDTKPSPPATKSEPPKSEPAKTDAPADTKAAADAKSPEKKDDAKQPGQLVVTNSTPSPAEPTRTPFTAMLVFAAVLVGSGVLGHLWAKATGLHDQGLRFGFVVFASLMSAVIVYAYWPPKQGIDLVGGFTLNYRIDRTKTDNAHVNMEELVAAITKRVNPGGTKEVVVRPYGGDEIEIIIPDATQEELASIKRTITSLGALEFRITANDRDHASIIAQARAVATDKVFTKANEGEQPRHIATWVPLHADAEENMKNDPGLVYRTTPQGVQQVLVATDTNNVTGDYLVRATQGIDRLGNPAVEFAFNTEGALRFSQLTGRNLPDTSTGFKRRLAILLDNSLYSAPSVNDTIYDRGEITGMSDEKKVKEQVRVLEAGRLPAALYREPTSELFIGPTLGRDTVRKGVTSMAVGTLAVVVFMLIYYRFAGMVANVAVVLNTLITVALMMLFQAAFTLSGLAGLALTVGMAVDANVLIYERMREELAKGTTLRMAIRNGFDRASTTIIDANVTTLIAGIVLYWIGTDQVKGFAVTLIIGLVANLFTAITVSRSIFESVEKLRWLKSLKFMQLMTTTNIDFLGVRRLAVTGSLLVIGIGLAACWVRGKGLLDIDFTGGTSVQVLLKEAQEIEKVRELVHELPDVTVQDVKLADEQPGLRYQIVTSKSNTVVDAGGQVVEDDIVEKQLYGIFKGQLAANVLTIGEVKSLAKPSEKKGAALEWRAKDSLAAVAAEDLLAQADTKAADTKASPTTKDAAPAATTPAAPAATAPAADAPVVNVDPYEGGTQITLTFSEAIGQEVLSGLINAQLKQANKENTAFELLEPKQKQGNTSSYGQWTLKIAQPQADATKLLETLRNKLINEPFFPASSQVGATVAGTTQQQALWAIIISLALILAYVWFRFSQVTFGIAAVVAVIHDVLVTLGFLALSYWLAGPLNFLAVDQFKINLPIIAAFLTIIGYSLNDTIVIFDRIREIRGKSTAITADLINLSVNQTLSRTLLTASTVFLTVLILYVLGGQGIHGFAFALVIGSIAGTYSTIYIATPIVLWLHEWQSGSSQKTTAVVAQQSAS